MHFVVHAHRRADVLCGWLCACGVQNVLARCQTSPRRAHVVVVANLTAHDVANETETSGRQTPASRSLQQRDVSGEVLLRNQPFSDSPGPAAVVNRREDACPCVCVFTCVRRLRRRPRAIGYETRPAGSIYRPPSDHSSSSVRRGRRRVRIIASFGSCSERRRIRG